MLIDYLSDANNNEDTREQPDDFKSDDNNSNPFNQPSHAVILADWKYEMNH